MQSTSWTPEHTKALRDYLAGGMSYSEIAQAINAKFGTAYSRSAAIGRAKRMELAGPGGPDDLSRSPPRMKRPHLERPRERHIPEFMRRIPIFEREETAKLRCAEVDPRHLSLGDLEPGDCRYPCGGDQEGEAITFCGHPRRRGSSYCGPHFYLTRGPGTAPERAAVLISLRLVKAARHVNVAGDIFEVSLFQGGNPGDKGQT
jgi:GcrA cell cycle regulator